MKQLWMIVCLAWILGVPAAPVRAAEIPAPADASAASAKAAVAAGAATGSSGSGAASTASAGGSPQVRVVTSQGSFVIELNPERAPLTVAHFLKYVDQGQYTNTIFHRTIANFVIQGGGYDVNYKLKPAPIKVVNESGNGLTNARGTVGLARSTEPHAGDCQFYVNLLDNGALDPSRSRWGYAVFGRVVDGMDVVDRIGSQSTGARGPFKEDAPLQQVIIERVERVTNP
jgi:cyclophilin family peptidyl-prolyl cis-trans isomerase